MLRPTRRGRAGAAREARCGWAARPETAGGPRPGGSALTEQVVQLALQVDELAFPPRRDDLERPQQEAGERRERRLEVRLPVRRGERDVEHVPVGSHAGPDVDVSLACRAGQARGQQVPTEGPLHRVVHADVEGHPYRVRVVSPVIQTRRERNPVVLWNDEPQPQFRCYGSTAIHSPAKPLLCPAPAPRAVCPVPEQSGYFVPPRNKPGCCDPALQRGE